jgi:hypothetical protein
MTITPYGFDGSLDEARWATMWHTGTGSSFVGGVSDWRVSSPAGSRAVTFNAGTAFSRGILATSDATTTITLDAPSAGQWFLCAMSIDWSTNTVTPVVLAGAVTSTSTPSNIPTSFPASFATVSGAQAHMPIAWAWANINSTNVVLVDIRTVRPSYTNQGIWGPGNGIPSGPAGARDVYYNLATNNLSYAGQNYVQGAHWYNTDTDRLERFYGRYDATTNPGGAMTSGWYPATALDSYSTTMWNSDGGATVTLSPAGSAYLRTLTFTTQVPSQFDLIGITNFNSSSNASSVNIAGRMQMVADGRVLDNDHRFHTHGSSGNVSYPWRTQARVALPPGNHSISLRASIESASSNGGYFQDNTIMVWGL